MALDTDNFSLQSSGFGSTSPKNFSYETSDTFAVATASAYFNNVVNLLRQFDRIDIEATDDRGLMYVSSATAATPVTVVEYAIAKIDPGTIVNADINASANIAVTKFAVTAGSIIIGAAGGAGTVLDVSTDTGIMVGNATTATVVVMSGDVTMTNAGVVTLTPNNIDGTEMANVVNINVIGGIPQLFRVLTVAGGTASIDVIVTHKIRVIDSWIVCKGTGTAGDTITILNTANAITDAMDGNIADTTIARASTIDDANHEIAAGGTLRVTATDGGGADIPAYDVYVSAIRVA